MRIKIEDLPRDSRLDPRVAKRVVGGMLVSPLAFLGRRRRSAFGLLSR